MNEHYSVLCDVLDIVDAESPRKHYEIKRNGKLACKSETLCSHGIYPHFWPESRQLLFNVLNGMTASFLFCNENLPLYIHPLCLIFTYGCFETFTV